MHSLLTGWIGLLFSAKALGNGMIRRLLWSHHAKSCFLGWAITGCPLQRTQGKATCKPLSDSFRARIRTSFSSMCPNEVWRGLLKGLCLCLHNPGPHYFTTLSTCWAMPLSTMLWLLCTTNSGPRWWTDVGWKWWRFWKEAQQKAGPIHSKDVNELA